MKYSNQSQKGFHLKTILITIVLINFTINASAQLVFKSFEISSDVSGSGLGTNVCPSIAFSHNESTFSVGANFQRNKFNLSGIQLNYRYILCKSGNERIELFFSGNLTVHTSAHLSRRLVKIEQSYKSVQPLYNYGALCLKVIESYVGFGLKFNHTKKISTAFNTGFGGFGTIHKNYDRKMCREKSAPALQLRVALIYNFNNRD